MDLSHGNTKEVFFDNQDGYVFFLVTLYVLFNHPETGTTINNKKKMLRSSRSSRSAAGIERNDAHVAMRSDDR